MIKKLSGKQTYLLLWFGQFISLIGSSMTNFALMIWAYKHFGTALSVATLGFVYLTPYILLSPMAGVLVDKMNTKKVLVFTDLMSALSTLMLLILFMTNNFNVPTMYLAQLIAGVMSAFQEPAKNIAVTLILPKDYYVKASGLESFSNSTSKILAPMFAGALMAWVGIKGVMSIDLITFLFAVTTLVLFIKFPERVKKVVDKKEKKESSFMEELKYGFRYIYERRGLFWLLMFFVGINLIATISYYSILPAMILARSNNNEIVLGVVQAALGVGGIVGSLFVTSIKRFNNRIFAILFSAGASFIIGDLLMAVGRNVILWSIAAFMSSFFIPFIMGGESALWRSKVDPEVQGRVFSIKSTLQISSMPIGYLLGGILADNVFEPLMLSEGMVQNIFKGLVGSFAGSGMALMFLFSGVVGMFICFLAYLNDEVRNIENRIPDHDYVPENF